MGGGARRRITTQLQHPHHPVGRDHSAFDHDVVTAGRSQAGTVPRVLHPALSQIDQRKDRIGRSVAALRRNKHQQDRPAAKIDAARKPPAPADVQLGPVTLDRDADGQKRRREGDIRIIAPDLGLGLVGKHTGHPAMTGNDASDPTARCAGAAQFPGKRGLRPVLELHAAVTRRLQHAVEASLAKIAVGVGRYPSVQLGLTRAFDQDRTQISGAVDKLFFKGRFIRRRFRRL